MYINNTHDPGDKVWLIETFSENRTGINGPYTVTSASAVKTVEATQWQILYTLAETGDVTFSEDELAAHSYSSLQSAIANLYTAANDREEAASMPVDEVA